MKKQTLREVAKFFSGMVLGKVFFLMWAYGYGLFPLTMWGVTWEDSSVCSAIVFNLALCWVLAHYGWHIGKIPSVREKNYFSLVGLIFAIVGVLHLIRLFTGGMEFILFGWAIPLWFSWVGAVIAGFLSYMSFELKG